MYLEAVTVCESYADFFAWAALINKKQFDDWIIVTSEKDYDTWKVCQFYNIRCIKTNIFKDGYNKGKAINLGLSQLSRKGWVLHLDGDICLPERTRELLELAKLDPKCIYGCDRINVVGYKNWISHLEDPSLMYEKQIYLHPDHPEFTFGSRVVKLFKEPEYKAELGWLPIGYFQLWNPEGSKDFNNGKQIPYNEDSETFAHSDMLMSGRWPREKRVLIPELIVYHLMTEDATNGVNWDGRRTKRFTMER